MNIANMVEELRSGNSIVLKLPRVSSMMSELTSYFFSEEPDNSFTKRYYSEVGKEFDPIKALEIYLEEVCKINVNINHDRFYVKLDGNGNSTEN